MLQNYLKRTIDVGGAFASHPKLMEFGTGVVRHVHRHNFPVGLQVLDTDIYGTSNTMQIQKRHCPNAVIIIREPVLAERCVYAAT